MPTRHSATICARDVAQAVSFSALSVPVSRARVRCSPYLGINHDVCSAHPRVHSANQPSNSWSRSRHTPTAFTGKGRLSAERATRFITLPWCGHRINRTLRNRRVQGLYRLPAVSIRGPRGKRHLTALDVYVINLPRAHRPCQVSGTTSALAHCHVFMRCTLRVYREVRKLTSGLPEMAALLKNSSCEKQLSDYQYDRS